MSLVGSAAVGGLRPDSDLDLLVLLERSLDEAERVALTSAVLDVSGRQARVRPGRPLEVTCMVVDDVVPWRYPPRCDYLYGEWLRAEYDDGLVPQPAINPDLVIQVTSARVHALVLSGPAPAEVLAPVPHADVVHCIHDSLNELRADLVGDERNVLLTLARMLLTLRIGTIVPKDVAAQQVAESEGGLVGEVLTRARGGYLGEVEDHWDDRIDEVIAVADRLVGLISDS